MENPVRKKKCWALSGGGFKCCVDGCTSSSKREELKFHRIPKDEYVAKRWLRNLRIPVAELSSLRNRRVCSKHFAGGIRKGRESPVYSFQNENDFAIQNTDDAETGHDPENGCSIIAATSAIPLQVLTQQGEQNKMNKTIFATPNTDGAAETGHDPENEFTITASTSAIPLQVLAEGEENKKSEEQLSCDSGNKSFVDIDYILKKTSTLKFYTGFSDIKKYNMFCNICSQLREKHNEFSFTRIRKVNEKTQLFIFFSRLRVGILEEDLAIRHNLTQSSVSRIFRFWLNIIYVYFLQLPIWPSKSLVKQHMAECFRRRYPSTRVILDATEMIIERPSDCNIQSATYSSYKASNTAKGLIAISPNGFISFVSEVCGGRISDRELFIKSKLLQKLEPGDSVMADRGFLIEEDLRAADVTLNIPPFLDGAQQLGEFDEQTTRDIASVRIHVERAIRQIKIWRILRGPIPNSMSDQVNQLWTVCSILSNFTRSPLLEK